jgi:hypothetical protein
MIKGASPKGIQGMGADLPNIMKLKVFPARRFPVGRAR